MVLGGIGDETDQSAAQGAVIARALRAGADGHEMTEYGRGVRQYVMANPDNDPEALAFSALRMWPDGYPLRLLGDDIEQAELPVLIVNGANDHPYVDSADQLAATLRDARHVRISDTDHMTVVADERFMQVVLQFLTGE